MNQLTRQEVEAVVERLADKKYKEHMDSGGNYMSSTREIYIGDILENINSSNNRTVDDACNSQNKIIALWSWCGKYNISLQDIIKKHSYEKLRKDTDLYAHIAPSENEIPNEPSVAEIEVLKSPEANALFSFLLQIGL